MINIAYGLDGGHYTQRFIQLLPAVAGYVWLPKVATRSAAGLELCKLILMAVWLTDTA